MTMAPPAGAGGTAESNASNGHHCKMMGGHYRPGTNVQLQWGRSSGSLFILSKRVFNFKLKICISGFLHNFPKLRTTKCTTLVSAALFYLLSDARLTFTLLSIYGRIRVSSMAFTAEYALCESFLLRSVMVPTVFKICC
jgi:hypothetical protein